MAFLLPNMRIYLTGDSDPLSPVGVSVLVCNHVMEGDWWAILMLARCVGLRGSVKPFLQSNVHVVTMNEHQATTDASVKNSNNNGGGCAAAATTTTGGTTSTNISTSASAPLLNNVSSSSSASSTLGFMKRVLSHQGVAGGIGTSIGNGNIPTPTTSNTVNISNNNNNNSPRLNNTEPSNNNASTTTTIGNSVGGSGVGGTHTRSSSPTTHTTTNTNTTNNNKPISSLIFHFLHTLLEFPILSSEHTQNYIADRDALFSLLRNFASNGAPAPVHLLLFPEGRWTKEDDNYNRKSMMTKSMEFAKREGRPQLQHLLLPRTTGFYASLDSLREASPVVYDITMAYRGYDGGETPFSCDINLRTVMKLIRGEIPNEVYIRIKRYSMEEVLSDAQWLDKQWAEKDRLLGKFVRCGNFANVDNRGFCRYRVLDSRGHSVESSITAILRLGLIPFAIPVIVMLFIPLLWGVAWAWIAHRTFLLFFPGGINELIGVANMGNGYRYGRNMNMNKEGGSGNQDDISNGGTDSTAGTPFFPATPFASPTHVASWMSAAPTTSTKDSD